MGLILRVHTWSHRMHVLRNELKNLLRRRDEWQSVTLTAEEKQAARAYMKKHYGRAVPTIWHRLYKSTTGHFDERYFPEILFSMYLEEKLNPHLIAKPLSNKVFCPQQLFADLPADSGIRVPRALLINANGMFWRDGAPVSREEAEACLGDAGEVIVKPSIDTMGARNVRLFRFEGGKDALKGQSAAEVLALYKSNFLVQERIRCHASIAGLYGESVNTCRVITYLLGDKVHTGPISMRIGMGGRVVDNGSLEIGVEPDGSLHSRAYGKYHNTAYDAHPDTGVRFEGYRIGGVPAMTEAARRLHGRLPQLGMISWDLTYDREGRVVVIEVNTTGQSLGFTQRIPGQPAFGENTPAMYALIRKGPRGGTL